MAQIINVDPQKKDDMFYRYKMPAILTKIEGNGNGIKTVFPNIREVCQKLQRPPEVLNKFFGYELGAQSTFVKADDKFLVMGAFEKERIQEKVYAFVERVVLCKQCRNPETDPRVEKGRSERLLMTCRSCGKDTEVSSTERIYKFMVDTYKEIAKNKKKAAAQKPAENADAGAAGADAAGAGAASGDASEAAAPPAPAAGTKVKIETKAEQLATANPVTELADLMRQVPRPSTERVVQRIMEIKTECNVGDAVTIRFVWRGTLEGVEGSRFISELQSWLPVLRQYAHKDKQYQSLVKEVANTCRTYKAPEKFPMVLKMLWEEGVLPESEIREFIDNYKGKEVPKDFAAVIKQKSRPLMQWFAGQEIEG